MHQKYFEKILELKEEYYKFWEDVCNIESPTNFKEGVDRVGKHFGDHAEKLGLKVEYFPQKVSGDVVSITLNPEVDAAPITVSGHMDTVHPVGSFGTPAAHRDEEWIYGPGATDDKGGCVAGMLVLDALKRCGYKKRPVQLLLQSDEEVSSKLSGKKTIGYICEKAKDSIAFINLETYKRGRACIERKGSVSYRFTVTGKAGHSSRCCTEGANAVVDAAHKMIELSKFRDDSGITCNCAVVKGGTVENAIPEHCEFTVNFRFLTQKDLEFVENYVKELAATVHVEGCTCKVEQISLRTCMEKTSQNLTLLEKVNKIFSSLELDELHPVLLRGGSDAADASAYGIPCLDSQGVMGNGSHTKNERALLSSLEESAMRVAAIATYLE